MTTAEKNQSLAEARALIASLSAQLAAAQNNLDAIMAIVPVDPPTLGSISGRVCDEGGKGIGGIVVYNDANNDHAEQASELHTVTDANGAYSFSGLAAGAYKIRAILIHGYTQVTPTTPAGVDPTTAYYGRTISLAGGQVLSGQDFVFHSIAPTPAPAPAPGPIPTPTPPVSQPAGSVWEKGMCCTFDTPSKILLATAADLNCTWLRTWIGANGWDAKLSPPDISAYHGKLKIRPVVTDKSKPGYAAYLAFFKAFLPKLAAAGYDAVELGNELHFVDYGAWTVDQAMDLQRAAHDARAATGAKIKLVSCSCFDFGYLEHLLQKGLADLVDEIAIHNYPTDGATKARMVRDAVAMIRKYANKPVTETEENIHWPKSDLAGWGKQQEIYYPVIRTLLASAAYFYATSINTQAGPAYLIESNGAPHEPFHGNWKSA